MSDPIHTLGINAAFHDSAACLVRDGVVVAAAEEERFTHVKHAKRPVPFSTWELPYHAIDYCLAEAGIALADVQHVAYSYDPWLELDRHGAQPSLTLPLEPSAHAAPAGGVSPWHPLFLSSIVNAPRQLAGGAPHHLQRRFRGVTHDGPFRWHFVEHHLAHEASAFLAAPFDHCAVMTMDGRGERATTSYGAFDGRTYRRLGQVDLPHSLGLLYERVTRYLGFLHSSDEYKVMALASYGKPVYAEPMRGLVRYCGEGRYETVDRDLVALFGPARERGGPITPQHCDVAHALQLVLEETTLQAVEWLAAQSGERQLAMAGGVALNCVMNAKIRDRGPFDDVWVQPAAGDAGTALGAALWTDFRMRGARGDWRMEHAYLGPSYSDAAIEAFLQEAQLPYRKLSDVAAQTAALLAANRVIGWFQGRMEFGPRALGARSILASPIDPGMQQRLNRIKDREDFRPVAPVVLEAKAHEWFSGGRREPLRAPFMLFVYDVLPERGERIPAVRHIDGTARVQTVDAQQHPLLHALLTEFDALTGVPVLVNTSFNTRGEPIVCTPRDAIECFWTSPLDALVIGSFLMEKPR
ncbi:carbamoyltransferase [Burkholderia pseudomultivorans]|uniref:Carbamoyltransferase family protein n=2 Tax=Burkholderia cepacia complex TaxID=87882 RepID=A0AAN0VK53_9BURK|nr:carbamoyltransferase C-terminal domain-containing protein [Burkholderia pseudomultivorans]AIO30245.1 carbamoyltransferase family protein [Burkholderia cenocepacia]KVC48455.1 carbamoyltransferase [Burkholderia pseudomultivorans]KWF12876.1 carbamoyltransferase [Burkholderia pseudomultivorans]KWF65608.1 carbamoyltransferase [Burkholderia pseudomultivorans]MDS0857714.1 carbamoyltransferase [Burkholderia pseudomultivorans]